MDLNGDTPYVNSKLILPDDVRFGNNRIVAENYNNSFTTKTKYVNLSSHHLYIGLRNGGITLLPPHQNGPYIDSLVINHDNTCYPGKLEMTAGGDCAIGDMFASELLKTDGGRLNWDEVINIALLRENRTGIYLSSCDAVVTLYEYRHYLHRHPFCKQNIHNIHLSGGEGFNAATDVNIGIKHIDNSNVHSRLFAIVHNRIMAIGPKQSNVLADGIYISGLTTIGPGGVNLVRKDIHYSVEDVLAGKAPVLMFKSLSEAVDIQNSIKAIDDRDAVNKEHEAYITKLRLEKERLEHENNLMKAEQLKQKTETEERDAKRQAEYLEQKQKHERELEEEKGKTARSVNSMKTQTETLKVVGAVLGFVLVVWKVLF
jgi:hypothetical protein